MNTQIDHVHMMIVIPPKYSISKIVQDMKSNTSRILRKEYEYLRRNDNMWSSGYYVSSVGMDEERTRNYIKYQEEQDKGQSEIALF